MPDLSAYTSTPAGIPSGSIRDPAELNNIKIHELGTDWSNVSSVSINTMVASNEATLSSTGNLLNSGRTAFVQLTRTDGSRITDTFEFQFKGTGYSYQGIIPGQGQDGAKVALDAKEQAEHDDRMLFNNSLITTMGVAQAAAELGTGGYNLAQDLGALNRASAIRTAASAIGETGCFVAGTPTWVATPSVHAIACCSGRRGPESALRASSPSTMPIEDVGLGMRVPLSAAAAEGRFHELS